MLSTKHISVALLSCMFMFTHCQTLESIDEYDACISNSDETIEISLVILSHASHNKAVKVTLSKYNTTNINGINFTLKNREVIATYNKERKSFKIPGEYYMEVSPGTKAWYSATIHPSWEGAYYPSGASWFYMFFLQIQMEATL